MYQNNLNWKNKSNANVIVIRKLVTYNKNNFQVKLEKIKKY